MFIKEIELNNFRIYKGRNKISLLPKDNRNIAIVSGKNGYGKTTFLMSLVWCLYGKQMEKVDELYKKEIADKGGYNKYIGNSLNRLARANGESKFSVSVTFTDVKIPDITCKEIKITRSYDINTSANDKVEVLIDNYSNELMSALNTEGRQDGEEIFIREFILPIEIAKFFFFDAEKIVALAGINSIEQRKMLSRAYTEVLGIKKYEDLKEQLESLLDDFRSKSAKPEEEKQLNNLKAEIGNKEIEIREKEEKINDIYQEKIQKQSQSNEIQIKLVEAGDAISIEQLNSLKSQKEELELTIKTTQDELKDLYDLIPFGLSGELMMEISNQLENEKNYRENKYKQENVEEKTNLILNDLEKEKSKFNGVVDIKIRNFYETQIRNLIRKHFFADVAEIPELFTALHDFSDIEINEFNQHINTLKNTFKTTLSNLDYQYKQAKNNLNSINKKINNAETNSEDSYISNLRQERKKLEDTISNFDKQTGALEQEIKNCKEQSKSLKQEQERLRKKIDESTKYSEKETLIKKQIKILENFIKDFKDTTKKKLEQNLLEGLRILMHKKDFIHKVSVDINQAGDDVDINLYNHRNEKIDRGTFSMGERQLYASALLKALVDESDIEFPVFIDSPMQKLDKDHAESIIKEFYPNVSKQVVLLPLLHKELNLDEYNLLKGNISKSYLIHNNSDYTSHFIKEEPEHLINKYNELYAD